MTNDPGPKRHSEIRPRGQSSSRTSAEIFLLSSRNSDSAFLRPLTPQASNIIVEISAARATVRRYASNRLKISTANSPVRLARPFEPKFRAKPEEGGASRGRGGTMENFQRIRAICLLSGSRIEAMFRKSIATCYSNDPIHPGGFFIRRRHRAPRGHATTVHAAGNPISDGRGRQKRLRMSCVVKIYRLIDAPRTAHGIRFTPVILDFMRRLPDREPRVFARSSFHLSVTEAAADSRIACERARGLRTGE